MYLEVHVQKVTNNYYTTAAEMPLPISHPYTYRPINVAMFAASGLGLYAAHDCTLKHRKVHLHEHVHIHIQCLQS
jgi:hypothetical protein